MTRIYSTTPDQRRRCPPNALDVPNGFMVTQMCWHYRLLRKRGVGPATARNTIWQIAWLASMTSYRPTFVSYDTIRPTWPAPIAGTGCTSDDPTNHQGDTCPVHES